MSTITLTFGEVAENGVGMQQIGDLRSEGFTCGELIQFYYQTTEKGYDAEYYDLTEALPAESEQLPEIDPAGLLIIRNGAQMVMAAGLKNDGSKDNLVGNLLLEQQQLTPDTQYWDARRKKVLNKRARYNLCFSTFSQEANYEEGKGTVISFDQLPYLNSIRENLGTIFGLKATNLNAEGNYYYDVKKTGISYHGDVERRVVIAIRLGESMPLNYHWFYQHKPVGHTIKTLINHGDLYIMSEKAVGHDWRKSSKVTLRHAAGCQKYLTIKQ